MPSTVAAQQPPSKQWWSRIPSAKSNTTQKPSKLPKQPPRITNPPSYITEKQSSLLPSPSASRTPKFNSLASVASAIGFKTRRSHPSFITTQDPPPLPAYSASLSTRSRSHTLHSSKTASMLSATSQSITSRTPSSTLSSEDPHEPLTPSDNPRHRSTTSRLTYSDDDPFAARIGRDSSGALIPLPFNTQRMSTASSAYLDPFLAKDPPLSRNSAPAVKQSHSSSRGQQTPPSIVDLTYDPESTVGRGRGKLLSNSLHTNNDHPSWKKATSSSPSLPTGWKDPVDKRSYHPSSVNPSYTQLNETIPPLPKQPHATATKSPQFMERFSTYNGYKKPSSRPITAESQQSSTSSFYDASSHVSHPQGTVSSHSSGSGTISPPRTIMRAASSSSLFQSSSSRTRILPPSASPAPMQPLPSTPSNHGISRPTKPRKSSTAFPRSPSPISPDLPPVVPGDPSPPSASSESTTSSFSLSFAHIRGRANSEASSSSISLRALHPDPPATKRRPVSTSTKKVKNDAPTATVSSSSHRPQTSPSISSLKGIAPTLHSVKKSISQMSFQMMERQRERVDSTVSTGSLYTEESTSPSVASASSPKILKKQRSLHTTRSTNTLTPIHPPIPSVHKGITSPLPSPGFSFREKHHSSDAHLDVGKRTSTASSIPSPSSPPVKKRSLLFSSQRERKVSNHASAQDDHDDGRSLVGSISRETIGSPEKEREKEKGSGKKSNSHTPRGSGLAISLGLGMSFASLSDRFGSPTQSISTSPVHATQSPSSPVDSMLSMSASTLATPSTIATPDTLGEHILPPADLIRLGTLGEHILPPSELLRIGAMDDDDQLMDEQPPMLITNTLFPEEGCVDDSVASLASLFREHKNRGIQSSASSTSSFLPSSPKPSFSDDRMSFISTADSSFGSQDYSGSSTRTMRFFTQASESIQGRLQSHDISSRSSLRTESILSSSGSISTSRLPTRHTHRGNGRGLGLSPKHDPTPATAAPTERKRPSTGYVGLPPPPRRVGTAVSSSLSIATDPSRRPASSPQTALGGGGVANPPTYRQGILKRASIMRKPSFLHIDDMVEGHASLLSDVNDSFLDLERGASIESERHS